MSASISSLTTTTTTTTTTVLADPIHMAGRVYRRLHRHFDNIFGTQACTLSVQAILTLSCLAFSISHCQLEKFQMTGGS